jgi:hypothetical protein
MDAYELIPIRGRSFYSIVQCEVLEPYQPQIFAKEQYQSHLLRSVLLIDILRDPARHSPTRKNCRDGIPTRRSVSDGPPLPSEDIV